MDPGTVTTFLSIGVSGVIALQVWIIKQLQDLRNEITTLKTRCNIYHANRIKEEQPNEA